MKCKPGYKEKEGKCVKSKEFLSSNGKSYNPLKMWGSWVGATIGLFIGQVENYTEINFGLEPLPMLYDTWQRIIYPSIVYITIFFLLGWGIHSLCRRFKK